MATMKQIRADRHKWEVDPTKSSGAPGGTRYRLKEKYKKEQREKPKKATMRERLTAATSSRKVSGKPTKGYGASKTPRAKRAKPSGIAVPNPPKVEIKTLALPLGYKGYKAEAAKKADAAAKRAKMEGVDPAKHKEVQAKLSYEEIAERARKKAAAALAEGKRKRELGEYNKLFKKKGGKVKRKKKKYSAGGRVSYQGHDGNKLVSKYYS
jgi:nucleotide-binding universal stress UspA family protein